MKSGAAHKVVECPNENCRHPAHVETVDSESLPTDEQGRRRKDIHLRCSRTDNEATVRWRCEPGLGGGEELAVSGDMELVDNLGALYGRIDE
jgi:hypothetical protein